MIASDLKNSGHATEKHDPLNKSDYGNIRIYELRSVQFVILLNEEGYPLTRLVEALRYKPEGCGFDSLWVIGFLRPHYCIGVYSACNRKGDHLYLVGGKDGLCVGLTTLPISSVD